jgi:hypothetical protein
VPQRRPNRIAREVEVSFWSTRWRNVEPLAGAIVEDIFLFAITVCGLGLAYLFLGILAGLGYRQDRIATLEALHYWAYLAVLFIFLLDMVVKVSMHTITSYGSDQTEGE